jgi:hypothetical protein
LYDNLNEPKRHQVIKPPIVIYKQVTSVFVDIPL